MFPKSLIHALILMCASVPAAAQTEVFVDPVLGSDIFGSGTELSPFKTLSHAANLGGPLRVWLQPGLYSADDNGESFPISLPPQVELLSVVPRGAKFRRPLEPTSPAPDTVFQIVSGPISGPPYAIFRGLNLFSAHRGIRMHVDAGLSGIHVLIEDANWTAWRCVAVTTAAGQSATVIVTGSKLSGLQETLRMAPNQGRVDLLVFDSDITTSSQSPAVELRPNGANAFVAALIENTVLRQAGQGIRTAPQAGASVETNVRNCVFYRCGSFTVPQSQLLGAIIDVPDPAGSRARHTISNSIFTESVADQDMPQFDPQLYTLRANMVEQANLMGVGGSFAGEPLFVDAPDGDMHLLPGSAAIDAGDNALASATDADGDPRINSLAGPGTVDLGVDEFYTRYVRFHPAEPAVGGDARLRILGQAGAVYFFLIGTGSTGAPPGSGPALTGALPFVFAAGVVPGSPPSVGLEDIAFGFPDEPGLAGLELFEQVVFLEGAPLPITWSDNVNRHHLVP